MNRVALVCLDTRTGKMQRYTRASAGFPVHAGRAYFDNWTAVLAGQYAVDPHEIERFRLDQDAFVIDTTPQAA